MESTNQSVAVSAEKPDILDVVIEQLVYGIRDVNLSVALNDKKQIQANEYVVNALTDILERSGHKVVVHKQGKTYLKLSIDDVSHSI